MWLLLYDGAHSRDREMGDEGSREWKGVDIANVRFAADWAEMRG